MTMNNKLVKGYTAGILAVVIGVMTACSDSKNDTPDFDRTDLLTDMADHVIVPQFTKAQADVRALSATIATFTATVNAENLEAARAKWITAHTSFQYVNSFNFGPGGAEGAQRTMVEEVGVFPVDATVIEEKISTNTFAMTDAKRATRGLLAVEYLLFGPNADPDQVVLSYASQNRREYLKAVADHLQTHIDAIAEVWKGSYRTAFVSNNGTDVGSSTSLLYNEFVKSYEILKNYKLGLPLGALAGQKNREPEQVEAYYSGYSLQFIKAHYQSAVNIWNGTAADGTDYTGFKEYLQQVANGPELIATTEQQLAVIQTALNAIPETPALSAQIASDDAVAKVTALHDALQQSTRYFKADMSSRLGIAITYSSGDGD
jgi:predicted lipoprotein